MEEDTYPQLRQTYLSRRGSGQSRARCPTLSQLTHLTSTRSMTARSSLQPLTVWPISTDYFGQNWMLFPLTVSFSPYHRSCCTWESDGRMEDLLPPDV